MEIVVEIVLVEFVGILKSEPKGRGYYQSSIWI